VLLVPNAGKILKFYNIKKDMNEKKIDIDYVKEELDKVIKTLKPDSVFGYGSLYDVATHFYKLGIKDSQK